MIRCPVCGSGAVVLVVSPNRRAFCTACEAKWFQDEAEQRQVRRPMNVRRVVVGDVEKERFAVDWA